MSKRGSKLIWQLPHGMLRVPASPASSKPKLANALFSELATGTALQTSAACIRHSAGEGGMRKGALRKHHDMSTFLKTSCKPLTRE